MISSTPPTSPSQDFPRENHFPASQNINPSSQEVLAAQEEVREILEYLEREHFVQMIMRDKGVSREVAEAEYDFFS